VGVALCTWVGVRVMARRSIGVQGLLSALGAMPGVAGVPSKCGSDGRSTWLWMNPADFNRSSFRHHRRSFGGGFLVGCGHSGTTPTFALLGRHPRAYAYAPNAALEYSVKPNSFRAVGGLLFGAPSLRDDRRLKALARKEKPNATQWLLKSPSNVCRLGYILKELPSARIVGLVRDGRDVMLSLLERYPAADPKGPLVLGRWVDDNRALLVYARDPRVLVRRYEDLFDQRPGGGGFPVLDDLLDHLGLDREPLPRMLRAQRSQKEQSEGKPALSAGETSGGGAVVASDAHTRLRTTQARRPFVRAPPRWPTQMTPKLKRVFKRNHDALNLLVHFGYANSSHRW